MEGYLDLRDPIRVVRWVFFRRIEAIMKTNVCLPRTTQFPSNLKTSPTYSDCIELRGLPQSSIL
jgi:hypothetical protein